MKKNIGLLTLFVLIILMCACSDDDSWSGLPHPEYPDYTPQFGTVRDVRDGRTYKTTVINGLEWMAENLNYVVDSSFCYNDDPANCEKYGHLYSWEAAMALDTTAIGIYQVIDGLNYQGICMQGWHIPTLEELYSLGRLANDWMRAEDFSFQEEIGYISWYYLKSKEGWLNTSPENDYTGGGYTREYANYGMSVITRNGADLFGFSLKPAGWWDMGHYSKEGACAAFWLSDGSDEDYASIGNYFCFEHFENDRIWKRNRVSVRCVKD